MIENYLNSTKVFELFINRLKIELNKKLPGINSQNRMSSSIRFKGNRRLHTKKGSVLILIYPSANLIKTVFIKRTDDNSVHSGQIGLPGGKSENFDSSLIQTALREAKEEIGVNSEDIKVLGSLTSLYIPVSNYSILPVVGYLMYKPVFTPNQNEVKKIIEISLNELINPANKSVKVIKYDDITINAPYYNAKNHHIWGATAMILSEFLEIIERMGCY